MQRRIVIAGTGSGVGKTTVAIGLMSALKKRGLIVQGYKCGPDYIDPSYHTAVTKRDARNLDSWMTSEEAVKEIFVKGSEGADISVIEGVMGFYDGKSPASDTGSTAEISMLLQAPVLLIVNVASMARSAAAIVKGFQLLNKQVRIAAVIVNQAGSIGHVKLVKTAIEQECGVPVIGHLLREEGISLPERHLGLIPAVERGDLDAFFDKLGALIKNNVDIERLIEIAGSAPDVKTEDSLFLAKSERKKVKIAVAKDAAFNFYYKENFELLEQEGAELVFFSPLAGDSLPNDVDGLYLGGGFPEEFAAELAANARLKSEVKQAVEAGLPTLAECGGFMYLCESILLTTGERFEMSGVIPGAITMQEHLAALGYREVTALHPSVLLGKGKKARGHEFHYSTFTSLKPIEAMYETKGLRGTKSEGYWRSNLVAGYTHLHFASNPTLAKNFVEACVEYRKKTGRDDG